MFSVTRALRLAAAQTERVPSIRFIGRRAIPGNPDHAPHPHPASPTGILPTDYKPGPGAAESSSHSSFSSYRDHTQQYGPLQKTIRPGSAVGSMSGAQLGSVDAPAGLFFDRSEIGPRFGRLPVAAAEIEAIESGGAALFV